jgi:hypothetical protein
MVLSMHAELNAKMPSFLFGQRLTPVRQERLRDRAGMALQRGTKYLE